MEVIIDDLLEVGAAMLDSSKSVERVLLICPVLKSHAQAAGHRPDPVSHLAVVATAIR